MSKLNYVVEAADMSVLMWVVLSTDKPFLLSRYEHLLDIVDIVLVDETRLPQFEVLSPHS